MNSKYKDQSKINEIVKELYKVRNWSYQDFQNLVTVLPIHEIDIVLENEIQRMNDWLSKTYFHLKSHLMYDNLLNCDNNDFETLKNKMVFISETLKKFHLTNFFQKEMIDAIKLIENNKSDQWTIQFISTNLARCLLCKSSFIENIADHIRGEQHQTNLNDPFQIKVLNCFHAGWCNVSTPFRIINQVYFLPYSETQIECCICNKYVYYQELLAHLETHQEISYPKLIHWCDICKIPLSKDGLKSHLSDKKHEMNLYEFNLKQLKPPENVHCDVCDIVLLRLEFQEHIRGDYHANNLKYYDIKSIRNKIENSSPEQSINENLVHCDVCDIVLLRIEFQEHMRENYHKNNLQYYDMQSTKNKIEDNQIQCGICRIILLRNEFQEHIAGFCHQEHLKLLSLKHIDEKIENNQGEVARSPRFESNVCKFPNTSPTTGLKETDNSKVAEVVMEKKFQCHVCNIPFSTNHLEQHIMTEEHIRKLKQFKNPEEKDSKVADENPDNYFECGFCKITVTYDRLQDHIYGRNHVRNLIRSKEIKLKQLKNPIHEDSKSANEKQDSSQIECDICMITLARDELQEHLRGIYHQMILNELNRQMIENFDQNQIDCDICNVRFERQKLPEHINGRYHQKNLKQFKINEKYHLTILKQLNLKKTDEIECEISKIPFERSRLQEHTKECID